MCFLSATWWGCGWTTPCLTQPRAATNVTQISVIVRSTIRWYHLYDKLTNIHFVMEWIRAKHALWVIFLADRCPSLRQGRESVETWAYLQASADMVRKTVSRLLMVNNWYYKAYNIFVIFRYWTMVWMMPRGTLFCPVVSNVTSGAQWYPVVPRGAQCCPVVFNCAPWCPVMSSDACEAQWCPVVSSGTCVAQ